MTRDEAIAAIDANWPTENYTMLREALTLAKDALRSRPAPPDDLAKLAKKWRDEAAEYPVTSHIGAEWAATAVRMCAAELERAIWVAPAPVAAPSVAQARDEMVEGLEAAGFFRAPVAAPVVLSEEESAAFVATLHPQAAAIWRQMSEGPAPVAAPVPETPVRHGYGCPCDGEDMTGPCAYCCPHGHVSSVQPRPCPKCYPSPETPAETGTLHYRIVPAPVTAVDEEPDIDDAPETPAPDAMPQELVDRLEEEGKARIDHREGDYAGELLLEAAAALTSLARDLETARQERDAALADVAEMEALFCGIKEIHATPGWASAIVDGEGVKWFAGLVSQFFYQAGGKNYVEWQCSVDVAEFVLTCQRKAGKTPDQLRREAEASRDAAVRAARAETWAEAALLAGQSATAIRHMRQAFVASPVMGELAVVRAEALEQFAKGLHERATAAREGQ